MYENSITTSKKDIHRYWWSMIRPESLPVSIMPVFIGTALSIHNGVFKVWLFLAMLIASVLVHLGANIFNDYYDFKRGLDDEDSVGTGGALVRGDIKPGAALRLALIFFFVAILLGIYISVESSWWIAVIGSVSMAIGYLYTGGLLPIAYTPFGELFSGFFMGIIIVCLSYFVQVQTLTADVVYISIPITLFVAAIMLTNNIRDIDGDAQNGRRTLAIVVGKKNALRILVFLFMLAYALIALYIALGMLPLLSIIVLATGFGAYSVPTHLKGKTKPADMMPAMEAVGKTHAIFSFLLGLSVLISAFM